MLELLNLRCYKCNCEFIKEVETQEFINSFNCPKCKQKGVELDLGKKQKRRNRNERQV
jgi:hypothetical protein